MAHYVKGQKVVGFTFALINKTTGDPITAGTVTGYVTIDGGTQTALTNSPVHEGNGQWSVTLTAAEMNGDVIGLIFTHANAVPANLTIHTTEDSSTSSSSATIDVVDHVNNPKRVRTEEGSVQERSVDELIKADRYDNAKKASSVPWGMRIARTQPGGFNGRN